MLLSGCPMRPRCRWRIGLEQGVALEPYRLQVSLAANSRAGAMVRQEHIAHLGAIDGHLLPEFFASVDPAVLDAVRDADAWQAASIRARVAFWQAAKPRLTKLANRIGPDEERLRMIIHARIPWPKAAERQWLELHEARDTARRWRELYRQTTTIMETNDRIIAKAVQDNYRLRLEALSEARMIAKADEHVAELERKSASE